MYSAQTAFPVIDLAQTGRQIERQRRQAGLTVRDLQNYFGFEYPQAIYKWQHGECLPTVNNLLALARLLRVPMEDLLVYEDQGVAHFLGPLLPSGRPWLPGRAFSVAAAGTEDILISLIQQMVLSVSGNFFPF